MAQHTRLANYIKEKSYRWLITYDDHPLIHDLYSERAKGVVELSYQMQQAKFGKELFVASTHCRVDFPVNTETNQGLDVELPKTVTSIQA